MEVTVEEIHIGMTGNAGAPGARTTTTGQSLWRQVSPALEQTKEEVNLGPTTGATTAEAVVEAVDTTVGNHEVMDIEGKNGGDRIGPHKKTL